MRRFADFLESARFLEFAGFLEYVFGAMALVSLMFIGLTWLTSPVATRDEVAKTATPPSKLERALTEKAEVPARRDLSPIYPATPGKALLGTAPQMAQLYRKPYEHGVARVARKPRREASSILASNSEGEHDVVSLILSLFHR
jgi:hypothetical protein